MAKPTSINVRLDEEMKNRIAAVADYYGVKMSNLVREWYAASLTEEEAKIATIEAWKATEEK